MGSSETDTPMHTRATPKQARARQRVADILDAAAALLAERPPGDLNTSLIAERAGVPVSSIYRYFPTLRDLLDELSARAAGDLRQHFMETIAATESEPDLVLRIRRTLEGIRVFMGEHPYYRGLLLLLASLRGVQSVEDDDNAELVGFLADRWARGLDGFTGGDPQVVATTAVQIALTLEDRMARQATPALEAQYHDEMVRALDAYLSLYLRRSPAEET